MNRGLKVPIEIYFNLPSIRDKPRANRPIDRGQMVKTTSIHSRAFRLMQIGIGAQEITDTMNSWPVPCDIIANIVDVWDFGDGSDIPGEYNIGQEGRCGRDSVKLLFNILTDGFVYFVRRVIMLGIGLGLAVIWSGMFMTLATYSNSFYCKASVLQELRLRYDKCRRDETLQAIEYSTGFLRKYSYTPH